MLINVNSLVSEEKSDFQHGSPVLCNITDVETFESETFFIALFEITLNLRRSAPGRERGALTFKCCTNFEKFAEEPKCCSFMT